VRGVDDLDEYEAELASAAAFASVSPHVPDSFAIDPEFACLTHAEQLADLNPALIYREGWTRLHDSDAWGCHAWCETATGEIVDPYFEWRWPGAAVQYLVADPQTEDPFDRGSLLRASPPASAPSDDRPTRLRSDGQ
jgi:hypothetical protein